MTNKINFLDCTLRDGAYICASKFGETAIRGIIGKLEDAGVDIIECGWLKNSKHELGSSFYHVPSDLEQYLTTKRVDTTYVVMIDWDRYDLNFLPECDHKSIDAIRVVFPHGKHKEGVEVGRQILAKGYKVYFQAANTLAYSDEDLVALAEEVNKIDTVSLSVVDTFGAMYEEDLDRIVKVLNDKLKPEIKIGFHSHNNQQLSYALTMHFIKLLQESERGIVVDASLCGMGRGAGNATTELVVNYLNNRCGKHYDMDAIMDAIDIYMTYFQEKYRWGYSTPYFIAGNYQCHVNNIAYLLDNHRTKAKDMRNIISSLSQAERRKYDYDLLEQKYLNNRNLYIDDAKTLAQLKEQFADKNILLIAPGATSYTQKAKINAYIKENKPVVIAVNAILDGYDYDYLFFVNAARYEYAKSAYPKEFAKCKKIVLSNIKNQADENEAIVGFNNVIKRGWRYFDNAAICALRLMNMLGIEKVAIAGFDGFKTRYNESYADQFLPSLNPGDKWENINREISEMLENLAKSAPSLKKIEFVTESLFDSRVKE